MCLWFQPKPGSVVICDFVGFRAPEMTKRRPVIVLRAHKRNRKLVYVVPLSTTPPEPPLPYHFCFESSPAQRLTATDAWAKCDMVTIVSIERLSVIRWNTARQNAARALPKISEEEFQAIRRCVAIAFGLGAGSYIRAELPGKTGESAVDAEETHDRILPM